MNYFIDTEFIESGPYKPIQLISIGIVSENGRTHYAISSEWDVSDASEWVQENVIKHLEPPELVPRKKLSELAFDILHFVDADGPDKPQFWGYYAGYDWVVFCQIFGTMMNLPRGFPMYCNDLKQWCRELGDPTLPEQQSGEHNALNDAIWNKQVWEFLAKLAAEEA